MKQFPVLEASAAALADLDDDGRRKLITQAENAKAVADNLRKGQPCLAYGYGFKEDGVEGTGVNKMMMANGDEQAALFMMSRMASGARLACSRYGPTLEGLNHWIAQGIAEFESSNEPRVVLRAPAESATLSVD